jgi:hypothetical protein
MSTKQRGFLRERIRTATEKGSNGQAEPSVSQGYGAGAGLRYTRCISQQPWMPRWLLLHRPHHRMLRTGSRALRLRACLCGSTGKPERIRLVHLIVGVLCHVADSGLKKALEILDRPCLP